MEKLIANVSFVKMAQHDNWNEGCTGNAWHVHEDNFSLNFTNTDDFKVKLADWVASYFDIDKSDFLQYVENEIENNRFDYSQNEDSEGIKISITEDNPDGYLCDYTFYVDVTREIDYVF